MTIQAVVQKGTLVFSSPLPMPDGTQVTVDIKPDARNPLLFLAENAVESGITDLAEEHDHYASGAPKRNG
jgi:hypothetical protein